ncbi:uncharacterized protein LOC114585903 isoform X1 [Podarcis muralis]
MEALVKVVQSDTQPLTASPDICAKEGYGYAEDQGSPMPGETASPKSYFQQSPSLPASGLTELSGVESSTCDTSPAKVQELPARRGSALTVGAPQKQYVGVRVKMPVCELLRKIRLSKGTESSDVRETPAKANTKRSSGRAGKRRARSERHDKQNCCQAQTALKSTEDLDILVEVLQEDLNKSHSKLEPQLPTQFPHGTTHGFPPPWWETSGNSQPDVSWLRSSWEPVGFQPLSASGALSHPRAEISYGFECRKTQQPLDLVDTFQNSCVEERCWLGNGSVERPGESSQGFAKEIRPHCHDPLGQALPETLEEDTAALLGRGCLKASAWSSMDQEAPTISFFQFQLCREESRLRGISVDKLLMPDRNGNRLLHNAVSQGKRALAYALARRFAHLNRLDGKNAAKQTALHIAAQKNHHLIASDLLSLGADVNARDSSEKTPLHLCAEKGYLRVLEVLKSCQEVGIHVEVDATDNQGLTPIQCASLAHCALAMDSDSRHLSAETWKLLNLRKDQILRGIKCLIQMGANPWEQGTNSSSRVSNYFAKVQQNSELMCFFQTHRPQRQQDYSLLSGLDEIALLYLQGEDVEPPMVSFPSFLDHSHESAM